jgi:hypothetical protein
MCLVEMFRRVGFSFTTADECIKWANENGDNWFTKKTWSIEDADDYEEWIISTLRKKANLSTKAARQESAMFMLNYGWTTNE